MTEARVGMVTGATGYVGGKVVERLLDEGWTVRALVRSPEKLPADWKDRVQVVEGDASERDDVREAMRGATTAWFMIHSMGGDDDFAERDRAIATTFAEAAREEGVQRIVYLGGLHPDEEELSAHLASRVEVGQILMDSGVPTAAVQAGVVLGDGSASFEMLRSLAERLPCSVGPRWLRNRIQPIHVDDVVHYLVRAAHLDAEHNRTFDVGGPDIITYSGMLDRYARGKGLGPRPSLTAPVWTPGLASHWISLVTPVQAAMAKPLVESVMHDTVVGERDLDELVGQPEGGVKGFDEAVALATAERDQYRFAKILGGVSAAVLAAAAIGTAATIPETRSRWFRRLDKPAWQPPNEVFGPVWSALYADIAIVNAFHLADLDERGDDEQFRKDAAALAVDLVLNAGWSVAFWRGKSLPVATLVAVALAASSADQVRRVHGHPQRSVLLSPYAAWTTFAAGLTAELWRRNR